MLTLRGVIRKCTGRLAKYDFFKDPIYFHVSPLSVYITNNMNHHEKLNEYIFELK